MMSVNQTPVENWEKGQGDLAPSAEHVRPAGRVTKIGVVAAATALAAFVGCGERGTDPDAPDLLVGGGDGMGHITGVTADGSHLDTHDVTFGRIHWSDLTYLGAFNCPDDDGYSYAQGAIAYVPGRNTLVVVGRETGQRWAELAIPQPVVSATKSPSDLHTATEVVPLFDAWAPLASVLTPATRIGDMAWFRGRFWIGSFEFYNVAGRDNLGISSMDENYGDPRAAWRVGPPGVDTPVDDLFHANKTHGYVMVIPSDWAGQYTPGRRLAAGRQRGAGAFGGARGPALYAFRADESASHGEHLDGVPLMLFPTHGVNFPGYCNDDKYRAIWIWSGDRQALVVASTKGIGTGYYGPGPSCNPAKGWHCEPYEPRLYFFDVNDLGQVARGNMDPWDIRPFDEVVPTEVWRHPWDPGEDPDCRWPWMRGFAFDEQGGRLFVSQPKAYRSGSSNNRMIIHVYQVS